MHHDLKLFLREAARRPASVVALAPSSRALAHEMTRALSPATGRVAELGAGTGRFTRAILACGVAPCDLTLFERNPAFVAHLRDAFPGVPVRHACAETLDQNCAPGLGAVVSGLPFLSMPRPVQEAILAGAFAVLRPGGVFVQFTYGPGPPVPEALRRALGLGVVRGRTVWGNLPPARVYTYSRAA